MSASFLLLHENVVRPPEIRALGYARSRISASGLDPEAAVSFRDVFVIVRRPWRLVPILILILAPEESGPSVGRPERRIPREDSRSGPERDLPHLRKRQKNVGNAPRERRYVTLPRALRYERRGERERIEKKRRHSCGYFARAYVRRIKTRASDVKQFSRNGRKAKRVARE